MGRVGEWKGAYNVSWRESEVRSKRRRKGNIKFILLFIPLFIVFLITLPAAQTITSSTGG